MLPYSPSKNVFIGNGVAVNFPFSFKVWDAAQLKVVVTNPQGVDSEAAGWTATLTDQGGSVAYRHDGAPLPAGWKLAVLRDMPFTQNVDLVSGTRFDPQVIEDQLDQAAAERQQLLEEMRRAVKVPPSSDNPPELLAEMIFKARDQTVSGAADAAESAADAEQSVRHARDVMTQLGNARDAAVGMVGQAGQAQIERVKNAGDRAALNVTLEGDAQSARVRTEGAEAVRRAETQAHRAENEAHRAETAASLAADISNVGPASKTKIGWVRVGSGIDVAPDGVISVEFPVLVSTPALQFPAVAAVGYPASLVMSAQSAVPGVNVAYYQVSIDGMEPLRVDAVNNAAALEHTPQGLDGATGIIVVSAVDGNGNRSRDATLTYVQRVVTIRAPRVLCPLDGDVDIPLQPALQIQEAQVTGLPATPLQMRVQIAADSAFAQGDIIFDSDDIPYALSAAAPVLPDGAKLYARARHNVSAYGWSAWGPVSGFHTIAKAVSAPVVASPENGAVGQPLNPIVVVSAIAATGVPPQGRYTQVQAARDAAFADVAFDTGEAHAYAVSVAVSGLPVDTALHVRARHNDAALGWSPWSAAISFRTLSATLAAPVHGAPAQGAVDVALTPVFSVAAPVVVGQSVTQIQVQISDNGQDANVWDSGALPYGTATGPTLAKGAWHAWRARLHGSATGWTEWSGWTDFTSIAAAVDDVWTITESQNWTAPAPGSYTIDVHGANGGNCDNAPGTAHGGVGGRAILTTQLAKGAAYHVTIGAQGGGGGRGGHTTCSRLTPHCQENPIYASAGGASSFGSVVSATGGAGGVCSVAIRDCYYKTKHGKTRMGRGCDYYPSNGSPGAGVGGAENISGGSTGPKCVITYRG